MDDHFGFDSALGLEDLHSRAPVHDDRAWPRPGSAQASVLQPLGQPNGPDHDRIAALAGYDDVFGQDGTQAGPIGLTKDNQLPTSGKPMIKLVTIIIPTFKPVAFTLPTLSFSPVAIRSP